MFNNIMSNVLLPQSDTKPTKHHPFVALEVSSLSQNCDANISKLSLEVSIEITRSKSFFEASKIEAALSWLVVPTQH